VAQKIVASLVFVNSQVQLKNKCEPFPEVNHYLLEFAIVLAASCNPVDFFLKKLPIVTHQRVDLGSGRAGLFKLLKVIKGFYDFVLH
jgi:hypothetical protein